MAVLVGATLAAYGSLWGNAFVNFDDDDYVTQNPRVLAGLSRSGVVWALTTFHAGNWHPLTWLSHMLDATLFGTTPAGHHGTSLAIHILNGLLLFTLLGRLTGTAWRPAFVAAAFLLHPLRVESVAWVAERKDVLSTLFFLLTLWSHARFIERPRAGRYVATLLLFALALMSKPMVVTLPFLLLLMDYWPFGRLRIFDRSAGTRGSRLSTLLLEKAPFLALAAIAGMLTLKAQRQMELVQSMDLASLQVRAANALVAYVAYLGKMLWPSDLAAFYPTVAQIPAWKAAGAGALLVCLTALALASARRWPWCAVGWLWFVGLLAPVTGIVHGGGQSMADRYTYVPLVGLLVIIGWGIPALTRGSRARRPVLALVSVLVLGSLAVATFGQVAHWRNSEALWSRAIAVTTGNHSAHNMLATELARQRRTAEAAAHFEEALRINPRHEKSHNNLGVLLEELERPDEAIAHYREALRIKPHYDEAHNNLGVALGRRGDLDQAIRHFSAALEVNPGLALAHSNLGSALLMKGEQAQAIRHLEAALQLDPRDARARALLQMIREGRSPR